jgi:hypothetical protein
MIKIEVWRRVYVPLDPSQIELAVKAHRAGFPAIVLAAPNADFTAPGKRTAKVVQTTGRMGASRQLRWYVGGRIWRKLSPTPENIAMTREWLAAQ